MSKVLVIGAGAAGLIAAGAAARQGHEVLLAERNPRPARKVMITGKGRCNLTNYAADIKEFISNVPVNGKFLFSSVSAFSPSDVMALVENEGVPLKIERGNRVFPVSDKAVDIVDALVRYARKAGVRFIQERIVDFRVSDHRIVFAISETGENLRSDSYILCTGGKSYPATGSDGDGYRLAAQAGHKIVPPRPALVPFVLAGEEFKELQGLSLKNIAISVTDEKNKTVYTDFGEMLFTHFGVSGPVILSASVAVPDLNCAPHSLIIDLKPALSEEKLDARLLREFDGNGLKSLSSVMPSLLPKSLVAPILRRAGDTGEEKISGVGKDLRAAIVRAMKSYDFSITGTRDYNEAIVTAGGVDTREIDPKTMKSKLCENLSFAGELIDVAAFTGGFNLQIAFSTGYAAGCYI